MSEAVKKEYLLNGLCCGGCAAKIEHEVSKLEYVSAAGVDFMSKTICVEIQKQGAAGEIKKQIEEIAKRHDSQIKLTEIEEVQIGKKTLYLNGLCCADCANKIEIQVGRLEGVKTASIDFVSQRLIIEAKDSRKLPSLIRSASDIVQSIEPDVRISYTQNQEKKVDGSIKKRELVRRISLSAGTLLFLIGTIFQFSESIEFTVFLISYLLVGGEVVLQALRNISKGQVFDENFLMSVATIGAFAIGEYPEGVAVMLFYQVGEAFQRLAVNRSRKSIADLMDIRPDFANLKIGEEIRKVSPEEVGIGDVIVVKPGEKIPLDGIVLEGRSALDSSALTGESLPRDVESGDEVLSGAINKNGLLTIEVLKEFSDSTVSKILDLVQNASSKKAPTENFITKFARYYTPVVTFAALALAVIPPLFIPGAEFSDWIYRALAFLVVSCPCALVISIPLSFFGGIGGASRNGILVKGSNYMEALNNVEMVVFDKTGTLTKGTFQVQKVQAAGEFTEDQLLKSAAYAESFSNHPIALSIQKEYGDNIKQDVISEQNEHPGLGISAVIDGKVILAGNEKLMNENRISFEPVTELGTLVHIAVGGTYAGYIVIADEIKNDSREAVQNLKKLGIKRIVMLTGDNKRTGEAIAGKIGVDEVYAELLPDQKVEQFERLEKEKTPKGKIIFVGDGVNDAPVLARADIGIAMGALGSDAAIEAADVVLMTDEPSKIVTAIKAARKTKAIVWQNILFAMGVKVLVLIFSAAGMATLWEAVFGDVGVTVIAIINAMRAMKIVK